jgi:hypothetical protein
MISLTPFSMISNPSCKLLMAALVAVAVLGFFEVNGAAQKKAARHGVICGNPTVPCKTAAVFQPNDLQFRIPENISIYDTDLFYGVILTSVSIPSDNCDIFVPESDRLAAQALFPKNKVFSSRCAEPGGLSYSNTSPGAQFMAVYGGPTISDVNRVLALVKATGKFPGANIRRMRAAFNGT